MESNQCDFKPLMLISGSKYDRDRSATMLPFTGIFAADGALLKEVKLEDDDTLHEMAASGDARASSPGLPHHNRAVDLSQVEMAEDGNVYLMRWTNPAIIYAISPGGEVVRRLKVDPGEPRYRPATMHVSRSRLAVLFNDPQTHEKIMKIMDFEGHEITTYVVPKANRAQPETMLGNSWACYTENPEQFVFVGTDDEYKVQLWIAEARY